MRKRLLPAGALAAALFLGGGAALAGPANPSPESYVIGGERFCFFGVPAGVRCDAVIPAETPAPAGASWQRLWNKLTASLSEAKRRLESEARLSQLPRPAPEVRSQ